MRFRLGLAIGFGAGYVLGSKAGRARYDQIRSASTRVWDSPPGRRVRETAHEAIESMQSKAFDMVRSLTSGKPGHIDLTETEREALIGDHLR